MIFNKRSYLPISRHLLKLFGVIGFAVSFTHCIEAIDLPVEKEDVRFLVIDGFLNTANGEVNLNLMRATVITETQTPVETGANVSLEDPDGNLYALTEQGNGRYTGTAPSVGIGQQYRLYIRTTQGREYRSAFVTIRPTPAIDSVGWRADADGTQIIIDTYDATNQTRYYRWTFEETWEYHSWYKSYWIFSNGSPIRPRNTDEMVHICFKTEHSTKIHTTSTANLTEDVVNDYEIQFLPVGTEKLSNHYSILVKQYAISKETFDYLEKLKKTSQDLSGLFAPQPSRVRGNVVSLSDPSEVVLGYFDAGVVQEERIFIAFEDLPTHLRKYNPNMLCYVDTLELPNLNSGTHVILDQVADETGMPLGFTYSTVQCSDCTVKGGVTVKPDFMPLPNRW